MVLYDYLSFCSLCFSSLAVILQVRSCKLITNWSKGTTIFINPPRCYIKNVCLKTSWSFNRTVIAFPKAVLAILTVVEMVTAVRMCMQGGTYGK